jgi:hypothetical protein
MTTATTHTIVGFYPTRERAETAVNELVREGFSRDQISILASQEAGSVVPKADTPNLGPIPETGSTSDAGEKAAIGSIAGFMVGIAVLAIPGIGPIIAAGPLAAGLTGAAAGAATGGLMGAFKNHGVPEEDARRYSKAIGSGRVMVTVHADSSHVDHAASVLDRSGAIAVDEPAEHVGSGPSVGKVTPEGVRAARLDESSSLVNRQHEREKRVSVHPGITGSGNLTS